MIIICLLKIGIYNTLKPYLEIVVVFCQEFETLSFVLINSTHHPPSTPVLLSLSTPHIHVFFVIFIHSVSSQANLSEPEAKSISVLWQKENETPFTLIILNNKFFSVSLRRPPL